MLFRNPANGKMAMCKLRPYKKNGERGTKDTQYIIMCKLIINE